LLLKENEESGLGDETEKESPLRASQGMSEENQIFMVLGVILAHLCHAR
jgi:hypothetical protein